MGGVLDYFSVAWSKTGAAEGKYSNNPKDPGGETMWGITQRVARVCGYTGAMMDMPRSVATQIAKTEYWDPLRLDEISAISPGIAEELFDTNINMWGGAAARFLQRSLNALNREQADFLDIPVDGLIGPGTVDALNSFIKRRGTAGALVMLRCLNALQLAEYLRQTEVLPAKEQFFFGWVLNRVAIDA